MIKTIFQITEEDRLPKILCNECNMKCNQWKQFKQQCENSSSRLAEMIHKKEIEFMDVGVIKEEESDDNENLATTDCGFDGYQSSDSDEKEKLTEIITVLNPVCEIKEEFLELKDKPNPARKRRRYNPDLILPPIKTTVKKSTDLSKLDQDNETNTKPKTDDSTVITQPTRNLQKRKSTKTTYADDDDGDNNSGKGNDSDSDDISYRKRPTLIYTCRKCRQKFSGVNKYEIHYVTLHMTNKEVSMTK